MVVFSLIIINKAGGLIYNRQFTPGTLNSDLTTNDYLVLAGTFHGVHAITKSLTPKIPTLSPPTIGSSSIAASPTRSTATSPDPHSHSNTHTSATTNPSSSTASASASNLPSQSYTTPNPQFASTGIEVLESTTFRLTCFQTVTGTKFLLFTDPLMPNVDVVVKGIYERYADYVMKNPFYSLEMPVRCEAFDRSLGNWIRGR